MILCLSPYHLTTREAAAMAALLLGESVITAVPTPDAGRSSESLDAAARAPRYRELMDVWSWSLPLWHAGILSSSYAGMDPMHDVRACRDSIVAVPQLTPFHDLLPGRADAEPEAALGRFARDILTGGPDPSLSLPVAMGLDRFAARFGLMTLRSQAASIAARAEHDSIRTIARAVLPVLVRCGARRLIAARAELEEVLGSLRDAIASGSAAAIRGAAGDYSRAFDAHRDHLLRPIDPDEPPPMAGYVALTLGEARDDVVLAAGARAAAEVLNAEAPASPRGDGALMRTLIVRPMGRSRP